MKNLKRRFAVTQILWWPAYGLLKIVEFVVNLTIWPIVSMKRYPGRSVIVCLLMISLIGYGIYRYYQVDRQSSICAQNLQVIYQALIGYQRDNGYLPQKLGDLCPKYLKSDDPAWMCPASDSYHTASASGVKTSYWYFIKPGVKTHCLASQLGHKVIAECFADHQGGRMQLSADGMVYFSS